MKKTVSAMVLTTAVLLVLLLSGCVSAGQIQTLQESLDEAEAEIQRLEQESSSMKTAVEQFATRAELTAEINRSAAALSEEMQQTAVELTEEMELLASSDEVDILKNSMEQLIDEANRILNNARTEFADTLKLYALASDLQSLETDTAEIKEGLLTIQRFTDRMMQYGKYQSNEEITQFLYGLVDIYDTMGLLEQNLQKLKDAMRLFVED